MRRLREVWRGGPGPVAPDLARELEQGPAWMYPWSLARGLTTRVLGTELPSVHQTRAELIEKPVRDAFGRAGQHPTALDLACNEGWFSHRLLEWGAEQVLGIDIRGENIRRAELIREHFGIAVRRLELTQADVFELDTEELGTFDVVLLPGLVYHVEDPMGMIRRAYAMTRSLCVIESQLTRQEAPIAHGWGQSGQQEQAPGSFATRVEHDSTANLLASTPGVLSLIPNRAALEQMATVAGFSDVQFAPPAAHHNDQYVAGDRGVVLAWRDRA